MTLVTDSPILLPDNLNVLDSPLSRGPSFMPFSPTSETEGDSYLTIRSLICTIPSPLKIEDSVIKLMPTCLPSFPPKTE